MRTLEDKLAAVDLKDEGGCARVALVVQEVDKEEGLDSRRHKAGRPPA
jgi:hypothetical protein